MRLGKSQRAQFLKDSPIEAHLSALVPALEHKVGIEPGIFGTTRGGARLSPRDFVRENRQQEVLQRRLLIFSERDALGERVENASETEPLERVDELGRDGQALHFAPPSDSLGPTVLKLAELRAKRAGSGTSLPLAAAVCSTFLALLSMRSMRRTSSTSNASARAQSSSTRAAP